MSLAGSTESAPAARRTSPLTCIRPLRPFSQSIKSRARRRAAIRSLTSTISSAFMRCSFNRNSSSKRRISGSSVNVALSIAPLSIGTVCILRDSGADLIAAAFETCVCISERFTSRSSVSQLWRPLNGSTFPRRRIFTSSGTNINVSSSITTPRRKGFFSASFFSPIEGSSNVSISTGARERRCPKTPLT